jgi:hypothetical protein
MSKKHFIALANTIKEVRADDGATPFTDYQIEMLANFCKAQNPHFCRERFIGYINGECGPNGGAVKKAKAA